MRTAAKLLFLLFLLSLFSLISFTPAMDLDVAVPPGTPSEWTQGMRQPVPTGYRGMVPTPGGRKNSGSTTTAQKLDTGLFDPFSFSGITTVDLPGHLPKFKPGADVADDVTTGSRAETWSYPPPLTESLHWYTLAVYLRKLLHPSLTSEKESVQFLTELGPPALMVTGSIKNEPGTARMVKKIHRRVPPVPRNRPKITRGKTERESMIYHLAAEELTSNFVYGANPYFAPRLLALGEHGYFAVAEYAQNTHSFLAQNAVTVLGNYSNPHAEDILRTLFANSKDAVVRNRALSHLIRRGDRKTVDLLLPQLEDNDFAPLAIYALGQLGDPRGVDPILKQADRTKDPEILWVAIPALARMGNARSLSFLRKTEKRFRDSSGGISDPRGRNAEPKLKPDKPDASGTRSRVLWQMAVLALACLGEKEQQDQIFTIVNEGRPEKKQVTRMGPGNNQIRGFYVPTHFLLLETLPALGDRGRALLNEIIQDPYEDLSIRLRALQHHSIPTPDKDLLTKIIQSIQQPAPLRSVSLQILAAHDGTGAKTLARELITPYAGEVPRTPRLPISKMGTSFTNHPTAVSYLMRTALQVLREHGGISERLLENLITRGLKEKEFEKAVRKNSKGGNVSAEVRLSIFSAPVLESAILELGRLGKTPTTLISILQNPDLEYGRAEAALALGNFPAPAVGETLLTALEDKDGWVRTCAAQALAHIRQDARIDCNWIYGSKLKRARAAREWKALLTKE